MNPLTNLLLVLSLALTAHAAKLKVASNTAAPEVQNKSSVAVENQIPDRKFFLSLDGSAFLLSGAGIKGTYILNPYLSVGGLIKAYRMDSSSEESTITGNEYRHELQMAGLLVDIFPLGQANSNGLYFTLAAAQVNLETTVEDSLFGRNKARDSKTGGFAKVGYQIVSPLRFMDNGTQLTVQLGAGYGNGGGVRWRVFSGQTTQIEDGLMLDLVGGLQF